MRCPREQERISKRVRRNWKRLELGQEWEMWTDVEGVLTELL